MVANIQVDFAGQPQLTDATGRYSFANLGSVNTVRVFAQGFEFIATSVQVEGALTRDFLLTPREPAALNLEGVWRVSLSASQACRAKLPSIARERKYTASLEQESSQLRMTLTSPTLSWRGDLPGTFDTVGSLTGGTVDLSVANDSDEVDLTFPLDLYDEVGPGRTLGLEGGISGTSTDREITAAFSGVLVYHDLDQGTHAVCEARDHEVIFKR